MQLFLSAKSSTVCDWFNNTQITKCLQPPGFLLCPECQIHSWICCKVLATSSSAMLHALADKHTHLAGHELTVGPVAPVQCTQAVLSPVCGWGVCLLGSAEELCYETQSLKAELLVDGPALPDKPDTNTHKKKTHSHTMFFIYLLFTATKALLFELHVWIFSLLWLKANEITGEQRLWQLHLEQQLTPQRDEFQLFQKKRRVECMFVFTEGISSWHFAIEAFNPM